MVEKIYISIECIVCHKKYSILMTQEDYNMFINGADTKNLFHHLNDTTKTFIETNVCSKCFQELISNNN